MIALNSLCVACALLGQVKSEAELKEILQPFYVLEAAAYKLYLDEEQTQKLELQPRPVLTWTNVKNYMGSVFVWTYGGRPELIGCIGSDNSKSDSSNVFHEFHSLSEQPLQPVRLGRNLWRPMKAGVVMTPVEGAPKPADNDRARLLQMRNLAREFQGSMKDDEDVTELRLLTQPIYRYSAEKRGVLDGAIFAMVWKGTDPEVLLMLEARPAADGGQAWHYGLARFNFRELWVKRKDKELWHLGVARQDDNYITGVVGERSHEEIKEASKGE